MLNHRLHGPHQLRWIFLAVMVLPTMLGFLGWRLLSQESYVAEKRFADQREDAVNWAAIALESRLSAIETRLNAVLDGANPDLMPASAGSLVVEFQPDAIHALPEGSLLYYPDLPEESEAPRTLFAAADELAAQKRDYSGAIAALNNAAASTDAKIRAAALVRIAGNYLEAGQFQQSLDHYQVLRELGPVSVDGLPAALSGAFGVLTVYERRRDEAALAKAARSLAAELNSGRWRIYQADYDSLMGQVQRYLPDTRHEAPERVALAEGVRSLWQQWSRQKQAFASGRTNLTTTSGPVLLVWRVSGERAAAFAAHLQFIEDEWLAALKPDLEERGVRLVLRDPAGLPLIGRDPGKESPSATRLTAATGLPWTLQAFTARGGWDSRRTLVAAGTIVLLALIVTGAWFVVHAVSRELAVAKLQSDFVSVVSHEFRTPLTALCQLSELLKRGRMEGEADRKQCYEFLYSESHRLRRLVESLLDFGRLESGKMQFRFEPLDAAALLRQSAAEFMDGQQANNHHLEVTAGAEPHIVSADRETLRCVFWNLFENAVKYSPGCDTVWVELAKNGKHVEIAVRDRGVGIPASEQTRIFEKFVRSAAARESSIRGTGIGLATARQIVLAHGGDITVESTPAQGSTFRVLLPLAAAS